MDGQPTAARERECVDTPSTTIVRIGQVPIELSRIEKLAVVHVEDVKVGQSAPKQRKASSIDRRSAQIEHLERSHCGQRCERHVRGEHVTAANVDGFQRRRLSEQMDEHFI
jgi:hypothetical protein